MKGAARDQEKFHGLSRFEDHERGGAAGDHENFHGLSRDNRMEKQNTSRIKIENPEDSVMEMGNELNKDLAEQSAKTGNDSEKHNELKGKRANARNKGIVEKLKREITSLKETIDRRTIEYDKLNEKNESFEKIIDTMAKERDEWRSKYIDLLNNCNNERQKMLEGYTQLYDCMSKFSGAGPSFSPI